MSARDEAGAQRYVGNIADPDLAQCVRSAVGDQDGQAAKAVLAVVHRIL